jgi:hypothetical protein
MKSFFMKKSGMEPAKCSPKKLFYTITPFRTIPQRGKTMEIQGVAGFQERGRVGRLLARPAFRNSEAGRMTGV